jgi:hypothetical protein
VGDGWGSMGRCIAWRGVLIPGKEIWAYGMSGPDQGGYAVLLDDRAMGEFTAEAERVDYRYLLFATGGLDDGLVHTLTLVNREEGRYLTFDYMVVQSETGDTR